MDLAQEVNMGLAVEGLNKPAWKTQWTLLLY